MNAMLTMQDCAGRLASRWTRLLASVHYPTVRRMAFSRAQSLGAAAFAALLLAAPARAVIIGANTSTSPISVNFDETTGRMTVTVKPAGSFAGATWVQGAAATGNQTWTSGTIASSNETSLTATATINGIPSISVVLSLDTAKGDLVVTLRSPSANLNGATINYPHPFYISTTSSSAPGYTIVPINSGHVVPTSLTSFAPQSPVMSRHMQFIGGTDNTLGTDPTNAGAWIGILESHADASMTIEKATVNGADHIGLAPVWNGSNDNASHTKNLLSYDRVVRYHFFPSGGYVAVTKRYRQYADTKGWLKTLAEKAADNPAVLDLVGAPIIYLWGDGHDGAFPGILKAAGINKALLQLSTNHTDQNGGFPNSASPGSGSNWFTTSVRSIPGFRGGFYDIYESAKSAGGSGYSGFTYLWPTDAKNGNWATVNSSNTKVQTNGAYDICAEKQVGFAAGTRLPTHVADFHMDAAFFDVLLTKNGVECYDSVNGHFETRTEDLANRAGVLNAAYSYSDAAGNPPLLTGSEQARDWAAAYQIWGEGVQHLGNYDSQGVVSFPTVTGDWTGGAYPHVVTDMKVLTSGANSQMASLLSDGYQVPLWDLVFHDCVISTLHWERAQNKFLYIWDHADLAAELRGQTALINLCYQGAIGTLQGNSSPAYVPNSTSGPWSMRWQSPNDPNNLVQNRVVQTYNNVCQWHGTVGLLEMTDHRWVTADRSVQMTEFSSDGGLNGHGIVVNFGNYDTSSSTGAVLPTTENWSLTRHGVTYNASNVPVNSAVKYSWSSANTAPTISDIADQTINQNGNTGALAFTVGDAETAAGSLSVSGSSSNTTLVPNANIVFGGSGANRTVTVTPATGQSGTATITVTVSDGSLTAQDTFLLTVNSGSVTVNFTSEGGNDGWLLESSPGNNTADRTSNPVCGNSNTNSAGALRIGDDAGNRQFRSIVSFNVTGLPAGAVIDSATLKFVRSGIVGNPSGFGTSFNAAIKTNGFGTPENAALQWGTASNDFSNASGATPNLAAAVTGLSTSGTTTTGTLTSGALALLGNGRFQFRIDFPTKTVNASSQDYVGFYSGENATAGNRPVLSITYHVP